MKPTLRNPYPIALLTLVLMFTAGMGWGQTAFTATYTFGADGNVSSFAYNGSSIDGVVMGNIEKVNVTTSSSSGNFRATNWPLGATDGSDIFTGEVDLNKYIGFTMTAVPGYRFKVTSITFGIGRSATGTRQTQWRGSEDAYATIIDNYTSLNANLSNNGGVLTNPDNTTSWSGNVLTLVDYEDLTSAGFRMYLFNSESMSGTAGLQGPISINGEFEFVGINDPIILTSEDEILNLNYAETFGPSDSQSFTVSGLNLEPDTGDIDVEAPVNFEVSLDDVDFFDSIDFPYVDGEFEDFIIYVRMKAGLALGQYNGDINISGGDAPSSFVSVEGNVTPNYDVFENFNNYPETGTAYNSGSFIGALGNVWNYVETNRAVVIDGQTVMIRNNANSSLSTTIVGGITDLRFDYVQAFATNVNLNVFVNGDLVANVTSSSEQSVVKNSGNISIPDADGIFHIEFRQATGGGQVGIDNIYWNQGANVGYVYQGGSWMPTNPAGNVTSSDDIMVTDGNVTFNSAIEANNLFINPAGILNIENILSLNGDITILGDLIFKSTATGTGQLDAFTGTVTGEVTVERYIPARRAFRFLSVPVTTTSTINANWQEGVNNTGTTFPGDNNNPNPGFGTHITGSTTGANGFDATPSGNPSMFTLDNSAQAWVAVPNTNASSLEAGKAYRILIRGDRSVNVTSNSAEPTNTTLRAKGALHTGTFTDNSLSATADDFNFFGNPYPAAVDMNAVIAASTNINSNHYYVWDPTMNTRGAYVTVSLPSGSSIEDSEANQYLQPGQAAFVQTLAAGAASLTFQESHKAVTQPQTAVFNVLSELRIRLFTATGYAAGEKSADGLRILFSEEGNNAITPKDARKFFNQDENLATQNNDVLFSIEDRALPENEEVIPLFINQYRHLNYVMELRVLNMEGVLAYIRDHYTGEKVLLPNDESTLFVFSIDPGIPESIATDRFDILFEEILLNSPEWSATQLMLFPNPVSGQEVYIAVGNLHNTTAQLELYSIEGRRVLSQAETFNPNGLLSLSLPELRAGVYLLHLTDTHGNRFHKKLIIQ